jgi:hypothetical protein
MSGLTERSLTRSTGLLFFAQCVECVGRVLLCVVSLSTWWMRSTRSHAALLSHVRRTQRRSGARSCGTWDQVWDQFPQSLAAPMVGVESHSTRHMPLFLRFSLADGTTGPIQRSSITGQSEQSGGIAGFLDFLPPLSKSISKEPSRLVLTLVQHSPQFAIHSGRCG